MSPLNDTIDTSSIKVTILIGLISLIIFMGFSNELFSYIIMHQWFARHRIHYRALVTNSTPNPLQSTRHDLTSHPLQSTHHELDTESTTEHSSRLDIASSTEHSSRTRHGIHYRALVDHELDIASTI